MILKHMPVYRNIASMWASLQQSICTYMYMCMTLKHMPVCRNIALLMASLQHDICTYTHVYIKYINT